MRRWRAIILRTLELKTVSKELHGTLKEVYFQPQTGVGFTRVIIHHVVSISLTHSDVILRPPDVLDPVNLEKDY